MTNQELFSIIRKACIEKGIKGKGHQAFIDRFIGHANLIYYLYSKLYSKRADSDSVLIELLHLIIDSYLERHPNFKKRDNEKQEKENWFLSNELVGMSLYVDRFAGKLKNMPSKLNYLDELGVNFFTLNASL